MQFDVEFLDALQQALLHIGHGLVVDQRGDLFQEEAEQRAGGDIADLLLQVFLEIALDGSHGIRAGLPGNVDTHA